MIWVDVKELMTAEAIDAGSTSYSASLAQLNQVGFSAIQLTTTATGTHTITQQASLDGVNFYNPIDQNGSSIGQVNSVVTTNLVNYIMFSPVLAPWVRFKVVPTEGNTVTLTYITQGDRL